jgi:hypothetical protein
MDQCSDTSLQEGLKRRLPRSNGDCGQAQYRPVTCFCMLHLPLPNFELFTQPLTQYERK